jgi:hypothetical protein
VGRLLCFADENGALSLPEQHNQQEDQLYAQLEGQTAEHPSDQFINHNFKKIVVQLYKKENALVFVLQPYFHL